jgi:hypothetical protein
MIQMFLSPVVQHNLVVVVVVMVVLYMFVFVIGALVFLFCNVDLILDL